MGDESETGHNTGQKLFQISRVSRKKLISASQENLDGRTEGSR